MTVKTELREHEKLKGKGKLLNPQSGQSLAEVNYTVVRYEEFVETFESNLNVEGGGQVEVFITRAELPDFGSCRLTLELKDGRRVTGLFKRLSAGLLHLVKRGDFDEPLIEPQP